MCYLSNKQTLYVFLSPSKSNTINMKTYTKAVLKQLSASDPHTREKAFVSHRSALTASALTYTFACDLL